MSLLRNQTRRRARPRPRRAQDDANVPAPTVLKPNMVIDAVIAQDRIPEKKRVADQYIHLTSLLDTCARQQVFMRDLGIQPEERVTGAHRVMWKMGRAAEQHLRDTYIQAVNYHGVYGGWKCKCERSKYTGFFDHNANKCSHCGYQPTEYDELSMVDEETGIVGNPDLVIYFDGAFYIIEIKSMNKEQFDALEDAVPNHRIQAGGYRRLYQINGLPVHTYGSVIYVKKDFVWGSPYKEQQVNLGAQDVEASLNLMWADAQVITAHSVDNPPPREMCRSATCTRAKNCPALLHCFQRG